VWPASIVDTWNGVSNLTPVVLTVNSQTAGGKCQLISGSLTNVNSSVVNRVGRDVTAAALRVVLAALDPR